MTRSLLLSVRPRFAQALLAGTKTVEIRRRFPDVPAGMMVVVYSSSPEKAVIGTMQAKALVRSTAIAIWRDYSEAIALEESELTDYLDGASECSVLELSHPQLWPSPVSLNELRRVLHLEPAQSFRYLNHRQLAKLTALGTTGEAEVIELPPTTHTDVIPALI